MTYASAYELKKALKRMGFEFEGLQIKQSTQKGIDFVIVPLDTSALYDPATNGFRQTPDNLELLQRMNDMATSLKDTNVTVGQSAT